MVKHDGIEDKTRSTYFCTVLSIGYSALKTFAGALLLVGWVICIRAAFVSLGRIGLVLRALVLGTLVWVLTDYGLLDPDRPSLLSWISLITIGIILGIGLSWSLLRARVTGQVEVIELPAASCGVSKADHANASHCVTPGMF